MTFNKESKVTRKKWIWFFLLSSVFSIALILFFCLGFHQKPNYIHNFEVEEYGTNYSFLEPTSIVDGLAVYEIGQGPPVLLFPYPHGHTTEPMAQSPIARILKDMGHTVIAFDVPGAYQSTRTPTGDIGELINGADEALDRLGYDNQVDVIGHSMGGLLALAYAIERPENTQRLVLINSMAGFPSAARCGFPGSAFHIYQADYWRIIIWGIRLNGGRGNLALHKQLQNLMEGKSYYNQSFFNPVEIEDDDYEKGVPIRTIWSKNMYKQLSYADQLGNVEVKTLILAGRHDPEASLKCSAELQEGIPNSNLVVFEESGHFPYIEGTDLFTQTLTTFLKKD
jgi:proline iminopeptidase